MEVAIAAVIVGLAYFWRLAFDQGRAYQRKRSVLNPGEAIIVDLGALKMVTTPEDFRLVRDHARAGWVADEEVYRASVRHDFHVTNPYAITKLTGLSG